MVFADVSSFWEGALSLLTNLGLWGFLAVVVLCESAVKITKQILKHRERLLAHEEKMAMIDAGLSPDQVAQGPRVVDHGEVGGVEDADRRGVG